MRRRDTISLDSNIALFHIISYGVTDEGSRIEPVAQDNVENFRTDSAKVRVKGL